MRTVTGIILMVLLAIPALGRAGEAVSLGPVDGISPTGPRDNPCDGPSHLIRNDDQTFDDAGGWRYGGVVPPDYGAFAEGFASEAEAQLCGAQMVLTTLSGFYEGQTMDVYVYASDGTNPSDVLAVLHGVEISPPAIWPNMSYHDIAVEATVPAPEFFIGWWGNWPGENLGWFCSQDLDGPGGKPRTKIAPGIGYPTGWNDPSMVWGPIQAHGIRGYIREEPTPAREASWGRVKRLVR